MSVHGDANAAVPGGVIHFFQNPLFVSALNSRRCAFSGTSGSDELAAKGTSILASLTMILLAALLCNYGPGFCLIDIGTEGGRSLTDLRITFAESIPSQYMRRIVSEALGQNEWDWRSLDRKREFLETRAILA